MCEIVPLDTSAPRRWPTSASSKLQRVGFAEAVSGSRDDYATPLIAEAHIGRLAPSHARGRVARTIEVLFLKVTVFYL